MPDNIPKKHHYIPRFILKNFADENGKIMYWDVKEKKLIKKDIHKIFMNNDMYTDNINHKNNPTEIENSLGRFESEIANLIQNKILNKDTIILNRGEVQELRIFLELLPFRNDKRKNQYLTSNFEKSTRDILLEYAPDGNFENLWKKELDEISKLRNYSDVENSTVLDPIIKQDFINLLHGMYMTIVDARGEDFLITDIYPTLEVFPISPDGKINLHLHLFFPISPKRAIVLNNIMFKKDLPKTDPIVDTIKSFSRIKGNIILEPKPIYKSIYKDEIHLMDDEFVYKPQKIYKDDVCYINGLFLNETLIGIAFNDAERIKLSLSRFNELSDDYVKQKFNKFENELNK